MHPYHWHWHRPSRLLWFVIGAVSAGWFIKAKETHRFRAAHCPRQQIPADGFTQQAPNPPVYQQQQQQGSLPPSAQSADVVVPVSRPEGQPPVPLPQYDQHRDPRSRGWGWGQGWNPSGESGPASGASSPFTPERWDEERKRMHDIRKQAQETFSDFSEATLNSLSSTVENLKAKLAEQRSMREEQAKQMEAMREEQARQFEEWKRQQPPRHVI